MISNPTVCCVGVLFGINSFVYCHISHDLSIVNIAATYRHPFTYGIVIKFIVERYSFH